jgi:holo-[acyl-carrier protein] synthase
VIRGIGTDIVRISRIESVIERQGQRFAKRILTANEMLLYSRAAKPAAYLAKRFAAKEAFSKALGTGIGAVSWLDIEVISDSLGAPSLLLSGEANRKLSEKNATVAMLSLSDEEDMAIAFVVIC